MKTLIVAMHAQSDWDRTMKNDFDRPITEQGMQEVTITASKVAQKYKKVDKIISSSAVRAYSTAKIFAEEFEYEEDKIETDFNFYEKGCKYFLNKLSEQNDDNNTILIVGHNPVVTTLTSYFIGDEDLMMLAGNVVVISFDINSWQEILSSFGKKIKQY
jgi:phosphohistidine phosphatase